MARLVLRASFVRDEAGLVLRAKAFPGRLPYLVYVTFLIDTGAQYSLLPHAVWTALGLRPTRTRAFHLADGTRITRAISECQIELPEVDGETLAAIRPSSSASPAMSRCWVS